MGKIKKLQKNQDIISIKSYMRKKTIKQTINGIKDTISLVLPNAQKRFYKLSKKQRQRQIQGRVTIAAIAAALGITGATLVSGYSGNTHNTDDKQQSRIALNRDSLLKDSNEVLLDIVYGEDRDTDAHYFVSHNYDRHADSTIVSVGCRKDSFDSKEDIKYKYNNTNMTDYLLTAPEIRDLIHNIIDVRASENPTEEQLQKLNDALEALEGKNFKLQGKNIVAVKEQDKGFEIE